MLLETISDKAHKALVSNSQATEWIVNQVTPWVTSITSPTADGYWKMGAGGELAPNRILMMPYGEGQVGQQFRMRLYYVNHISDNSSDWVWMTALLIECICTIGELAGPPNLGPVGSGSERQITDGNRFCQSIAPVVGSYGKDGDLNTDTGFPAFVIAAINGARFIGFDFKQIDENVTMNALWARA